MTSSGWGADETKTIGTDKMKKYINRIVSVLVAGNAANSQPNIETTTAAAGIGLEASLFKAGTKVRNRVLINAINNMGL